MPVIRVEMFSGRTDDQKADLVRELTDSFLRTCGGTRESVQVVIDDYAPSNWGVGGVLASEKMKTNKDS